MRLIATTLAACLVGIAGPVGADGTGTQDQTGGAAERKDRAVDARILAIKGDRDYGAYLGAECKTCHLASGADKGIPPITGWPVNAFVVVMHAYKSGARTHPAMRMIASRLSNQEIAALAAYFAGVK